MRVFHTLHPRLTVSCERSWVALIFFRRSPAGEVHVLRASIVRTWRGEIAESNKNNFQNSAMTVPLNFVLLLSQQTWLTIGNCRRRQKNYTMKNTFGTPEKRKGRKILRRWQPCCAKPPRARRSSTTKPFHHHHHQKTSPPPFRITHRRNITGARTNTHNHVTGVQKCAMMVSEKSPHKSKSAVFPCVWQACDRCTANGDQSYYVALQ